LQGQNKLVVVRLTQARSNDTVKEERKLRFEMTDTYRTSIDSVAVRLDEVSRERIGNIRENDILKEKLKAILEHVETREAKYQEIVKAQEDELVAVQAEVAKKELDPAKAREKQLRDQLNLYRGKFETFQQSLTGSNQEFVTLRKDMESLSQSIRKLEKLHLEQSTKRNDTAEMMQGLNQQNEELQQQLKAVETQKQTLGKLKVSLEAKLSS
jgi:chromosome segregation ATPase